MKLLVLSFIISISFSQNQDFSLSEIKYFGSHAMHNWSGTSTQAKTSVSYDGSKENGSVIVKVRLDSFDSKLYSRDSNMLYYTDAIEFPEVVFKSTQAKVVNDSIYIEGNLTFHGITKKVKTSGKITKKAKQMPARNKTMLENKTVKKPIFSSLYNPGAMKFHNSKSKYGIATNVAT